MPRAAVFTLLLTLGACASSTAPAPAGNEIVLEAGQTVRLAGTGITVSLGAVDDSRCRPDVQCVWAGNARVALNLSDAGGPEITGELNTHPDFPRALTFRYVRIELTQLDPQPSANRNWVLYRAHLRWNFLLD